MRVLRLRSKELIRELDAVEGVLVYSSRYKPNAHPMAQQIAREFERLGIETQIELSGEIDLDSTSMHPDLVVVVGGDGTMLSAGRKLARHQIQILGVNQGNVGFLARHTYQDLSCYLAGQKCSWPVQRLMMLQVTVSGGVSASSYAVNDVIIAQGVKARMLVLEMFVDDDPVARFRLEGLVVASPIGSTSYSLSVGGVILSEETRAMTVVPVAPYGLTARPVVVGEDSELSLVISSKVDEVGAVIDGQEKIMLSEGDKVQVSASPYDFLLVGKSTPTYFELLRRKLGWAMEVNSE